MSDKQMSATMLGAIIGGLTAALCLLKVTGLLSMSWVWALSPLWIVAGLYLLIGLCVIVVFGVLFIVAISKVSGK